MSRIHASAFIGLAVVVLLAVATYALLRPCNEDLPILIDNAEYPTLSAIQARYGPPTEVVVLDSGRLMSRHREAREGRDGGKNTRVTINIWRGKCQRDRRLVAIADQATGAVLLIESQSVLH